VIPRPLVLLVEDELVMRRVLQVALRSQGYAVAEAETGAQAIARVEAEPPDVVLLDLGLPDMDGVAVAGSIRLDHELPIIVLSARSDEQQQIRALDAGANDYVTKPFREGELMARVRAALRRESRRAERRDLVIGDLRVEPLARRVFLGDEEVALTPTEFKLLYLLAQERGRVVTHRQLLQDVWGPAHADEVQYLRVYMKQLRHKLEEDPARPKRLVTALGVGYRLIPR
jgi:two-component system KDP operon response regulator KdpE